MSVDRYRCWMPVQEPETLTSYKAVGAGKRERRSLPPSPASSPKQRSQKSIQPSNTAESLDECRSVSGSFTCPMRTHPPVVMPFKTECTCACLQDTAELKLVADATTVPNVAYCPLTQKYQWWREPESVGPTSVLSKREQKERKRKRWKL